MHNGRRIFSQASDFTTAAAAAWLGVPEPARVLPPRFRSAELQARQPKTTAAAFPKKKRHGGITVNFVVVHTSTWRVGIVWMYTWKAVSNKEHTIDGVTEGY